MSKTAHLCYKYTRTFVLSQGFFRTNFQIRGTAKRESSLNHFLFALPAAIQLVFITLLLLLFTSQLKKVKEKSQKIPKVYLILKIINI